MAGDEWTVLNQYGYYSDACGSNTESEVVAEAMAHPFCQNDAVECKTEITKLAKDGICSSAGRGTIDLYFRDAPPEPTCDSPVGTLQSLSVPDPAAIGFEACFGSCTYTLGGPSAYEEDAQGNVISWTFYEATSTGEYCETANASEGGPQDGGEDDGGEDDGGDDGGEDGGDDGGEDGGDDGDDGGDDGSGDDGGDDGSDDGSGDDGGDDGSDDGGDNGSGGGGGNGNGEGEGEPITWSGEEIDLTLSDTDDEYEQVMNDYKQKIQDIKNEVQNLFGTNLSGGGSISDNVEEIKGVPVNFSLNRFLDGLNILAAVILFCAAFISAGILFTGRG